MILSVLLHALAFALWPAARIALFLGSPDGPRSLQESPIQLVGLARPERPPATEAARPTPSFQPQRVAVRAVPRSRPALDLTRAEPRTSGAGVPKLVDVEASSDGGQRYVQPIARSILPEWKPPRSVYGVGVTVRVHVDSTGRATGLVELLPPTPDRETNRQLVYRVRQLRYQPAVRNGKPVPAWAEIAFVFCKSGVTATSPAPPRRERGDRCPQDAPPPER